jgi:hypothetical protein
LNFQSTFDLISSRLSCLTAYADRIQNEIATDEVQHGVSLIRLFMLRDCWSLLYDSSKMLMQSYIMLAAVTTFTVTDWVDNDDNQNLQRAGKNSLDRIDRRSSDRGDKGNSDHDDKNGPCSAFKRSPSDESDDKIYNGKKYRKDKKYYYIIY